MNDLQKMISSTNFAFIEVNCQRPQCKFSDVFMSQNYLMSKWSTRPRGPAEGYPGDEALLCRKNSTTGSEQKEIVLEVTPSHSR